MHLFWVFGLKWTLWRKLTISTMVKLRKHYFCKILKNKLSIIHISPKPIMVHKMTFSQVSLTFLLGLSPLWLSHPKLSNNQQSIALNTGVIQIPFWQTGMISYHYARFVMLNIPLLRWIERRKMVAIFWSNVRLNTQCFTAMNHSFTDVKITSNRWIKKIAKRSQTIIHHYPTQKCLKMHIWEECKQLEK